jgi:hypothetical protein
VQKLHDDPSVPVKILLYGPPGVGKISIADMLAAALSGSRFAVEEFNGKLVTVETVKQWMAGLGAFSLFGVYSVKIINEMDRCTRDAQDLLLSYLDRMPPGRAIIGTSNLQLDLLTERFQTRFQSIKLAAPSTEDVATMLCRHWSVDEAISLRIAVGALVDASGPRSPIWNPGWMRGAVMKRRSIDSARPIILLDLNYTLVANNSARGTAPERMEKRLAHEQYRQGSLSWCDRTPSS